jgi:hypothetical protein
MEKKKNNISILFPEISMTMKELRRIVKILDASFLMMDKIKLDIYIKYPVFSIKYQLFLSKRVSIKMALCQDRAMTYLQLPYLRVQ